nr:hypothetical transcript [Hymenolepis microstoma]
MWDRLTSTWCTLGNAYSYGKKSIIQQLTSNYHDFTACLIRPLPQYSPYLFSTLVPVPFTSVNDSSVPPPFSTCCDLDVPPLCEARSQLKG